MVCANYSALCVVAIIALTLLAVLRRRGRYTKGKDVAGICSFSTSLPAWAAALGACGAPPPGSPPPPPRTQLLSFVGGGLGSVRQALFAHYAEHPWPDLLMVRHHLAPKEYMHVLMTSKFCLVRSSAACIQACPVSTMRVFVCTHALMPHAACSARARHAGAEPPAA